MRSSVYGVILGLTVMLVYSTNSNGMQIDKTEEPAPSPHILLITAGQSSPQLTAGVWKGSYSCPQGKMGLILALRPTSAQQLEAIFSFWPLSAHPDLREGAYMMVGQVSGRQVQFQPIRWIDRPPNYQMVAIKGVIDERGAMSGSVTGCSEFSLQPQRPLRSDQLAEWSDDPRSFNDRITSTFRPQQPGGTARADFPPAAPSGSGTAGSAPAGERRVAKTRNGGSGSLTWSEARLATQSIGFASADAGDQGAALFEAARDYRSGKALSDAEIRKEVLGTTFLSTHLTLGKSYILLYEGGAVYNYKSNSGQYSLSKGNLCTQFAVGSGGCNTFWRAPGGMLIREQDNGHAFLQRRISDPDIMAVRGNPEAASNPSNIFTDALMGAIVDELSNPFGSSSSNSGRSHTYWCSKYPESSECQ